MNINSFDITQALTPLDGRYRSKLIQLIPYFSSFALDKYRIFVEIAYFLKLSEYKVIRKLTQKEISFLKAFSKTFTEKDYEEIREIEHVTHHDVKAIEEYIKKKLSQTSLKDIVNMIHFGLTSEDINNIAYALILKESTETVLTSELKKILDLLKQYVKNYKTLPMLSRTHGQSAAPTTVGKEFLVFYKRLLDEISELKRIKIQAKLTGNTGNLNAHKFILPQINWIKFSKEFISELDLEPNLLSTQIQPYDSYIRLFQTYQRINAILLGLCKDMWLYIMSGYFKQKVVATEVGSTALPHKVNPIYVEGAEGGFELANALFEMYGRKLAYSRLQRDLSDSIVRRSFGTAFGYTLLSYQSILEALKRISPNEDVLRKDLQNHVEVISEAIQNFLRTKGYDKAYEATKEFFRGKEVTQENVQTFIKSLIISKEDKTFLLTLQPHTYTGYAKELEELYEK